MPIMLPTPEELSAMPWYQRDRNIRSARRLLAAYQGKTEPMRPIRRTRLSKKALAERHRLFGELIRAEAKHIERINSERTV